MIACLTWVCRQFALSLISVCWGWCYISDSNRSMTEAYWQRYKAEISNEYMERTENKLWQNVKKDLARKEQPKHHLQLYSMCKSDNPYIRQVKNSPNITTETVAELICRDKACELQYCLSLMKIATENRRRIIDLKGCKEQYDTMWYCIRSEMTRINTREQELKDLVHGVKVQQKEVEKPLRVEEKRRVETQYI